MDWDLGISRYKLLYKEEINKVLLKNYIQCPLINHNGKVYEKECICAYVYKYMHVCAAQCSIMSDSLRLHEL